MDLTRYVLQHDNGIFLLSNVPNELVEQMKEEWKFRFQYGLYSKEAYYVKTEGNHTYLREW